MATERTVSTDRIPPQALDVERAVLSAMLIDSGAVGAVVEILEDETAFYQAAHRKIFAAVVSLYGKGQPVDQITVVQELSRRRQIDEVGGAFAVAQLAGEAGTSANAEYHARIVLEKAIRRKMIDISSQVASECYAETKDAFQLLEDAEQRFFSLSQGAINRGFKPLEGILHETFELVERAHKRAGALSGLTTGYRELDEKTAGLQPSDLIIVAGRPSMGKTAFGLCVARNVAVKERVPVGIFSLEMSEQQIAQRLLCAESRVDSHRLRTGRLSDEEWTRLAAWSSKLVEAPIFIDDTPSLSILEMRAKARRLKAEYGVGLIIVDYLQLVTTHERIDNREQEIAKISRSLKALSKELNVPVMACAQLSRAVETRGGDKRPILSDLRESGSIEQDADVVLFLYRPEVYGVKDEQGNDQEGVAEVIIGKQRNGPLGSATLTWLSQYGRFEEPEMYREEPF
jgi:replicative DNA helicase